MEKDHLGLALAIFDSGRSTLGGVEIARRHYELKLISRLSGGVKYCMLPTNISKNR